MAASPFAFLWGGDEQQPEDETTEEKSQLVEKEGNGKPKEGEKPKADPWRSVLKSSTMADADPREVRKELKEAAPQLFQRLARDDEIPKAQCVWPRPTAAPLLPTRLLSR
jgi:nitrogen fixation-related uncharacterized protein